MDVTKASRSLAEYFGNSLGYKEEKIDFLRFGFEIIIGEGIKFFVLILIALTYGLLEEMLAAIFTFVVFRFISGGAHSSSHEGCFVSTVLSFTVIGFAAALVGKTIFVPLLIAAFIFSLISITLWAPAENKNKPVKPENRKKLKCFSYLLLIIWGGSIVVVKNLINPSLYYNAFNASALAVIFQSFILSPPGFRFMKYIDKNITSKKEVREDGQQT